MEKDHFSKKVLTCFWGFNNNLNQNFLKVFFNVCMGYIRTIRNPKKTHSRRRNPRKKEKCGYMMDEITETIKDGNTNTILGEIMEENLKIEHEIMKETYSMLQEMGS